MSAKNRALGRGLNAIFEVDSSATPKKQTVSSMEEIALDMISPNPNQPRSYFDEDALEELADSIRTLGVIQPITLSKGEAQRYIIISGERRWRASQIAGLTTVPAYIREVDDQGLHEMALVENIQRQDLNPIEIAISLQRLIDECNLTQDMLSTRVGKKRSTIANYMRLLKLPVEIQSAVREDYISMGHAKAIAAAAENRQLAILKKTINKGLSVRQVEELVKGMEQTKEAKRVSHKDEEFPESYGVLVEHLERFFSQDIAIKKGKKGGGGSIIIDFKDDKDIERFVKRFSQIEQKR